MQRPNRNVFFRIRPGAPAFVPLAVLTLVLFAALPASATDTGEQAAAPGYEEIYGVKIHGIRSTAGGFMMDFRFTVTDPEKALPLFDSASTPYLEVVKNGAKFTVPNPPKVGSLRPTGTPELGRTYWIFFANPGRYVSLGTELRVVAGDVRIEHLVLE